MTTGTIFDIKRYAIHDGPGIRTTLFLKGCGLDCWWCHNPEGIGSNGAGRSVTVAEAAAEIEKDALFYDESGGGATFSGGEPLAQAEFLGAMLDWCREVEIHTVVDTSGYAPPEVFDTILSRADLFHFDLKLMDDAAHRAYTGVSNEMILENLANLERQGKRTIIRFPVIPTITDGEENLAQILDFLASRRGLSEIDLLPYHKTAQGKYRRLEVTDRMGAIEPPTPEQTQTIKKRFEERGLRVRIGG